MKNPPSKQLRSFMLGAMAWPFIITGSTALFFGLSALFKAQSSIEWPTVEGIILSSSIEPHRSSDSGTTYHAEIFYEYIVDNNIFNGNRVAYGDYGSSDPSHARNIVNRYPENKIVIVYYMPNNPEKSLLEPGIQGQTWFLPGVGFIFFCVGCGMWHARNA